MIKEVSGEMNYQLTKDDIENMAYERMAKQRRPLFLTMRWSLRIFIFFIGCVGILHIAQDLSPYNEWLVGVDIVPSEFMALIIFLCLGIILTIGLLAHRRFNKHAKAWVKEYNLNNTLEVKQK